MTLLKKIVALRGIERVAGSRNRLYSPVFRSEKWVPHVNVSCTYRAQSFSPYPLMRAHDFINADATSLQVSLGLESRSL
jgi:hypothetical protein